MPKVFLANKKFHMRYSEAKEHGELVPLTIGNVNIFAPDNLVAQIVGKLTMNSAGPEDFLLISGYPIINAVAVHWFLCKFGKLKMLVWDNSADRYKVVTLYGWMPCKVRKEGKP